jgi:preprotein translocase subunit SecE
MQKTAAHIEWAIKESFVAGFRTVMVVCVGLALISALAAALLVNDQREKVGSREPYPSD